jgi:hypothetical protein
MLSAMAFDGVGPFSRFREKAGDEGAWSAFGPFRRFVAGRKPASERGLVAGADRTIPAPVRPFPRAVAAPPFSGPRSRRTTAARNAQLHQHQPSASTARTPRMVPPPGGTTTALLPPTVTVDALGCTPAARAGGSGYGRRSHSRCPGTCRAWLVLMAPRRVGHIGCPASVDRRTYPGPPALAPTHGRLAGAQRAATARKPPFLKCALLQASRVARNSMDH